MYDAFWISSTVCSARRLHSNEFIHKFFFALFLFLCARFDKGNGKYGRALLLVLLLKGAYAKRI